MKHHEALMPQIIPANICKISIVSSFAQLARFSWPNSRSQAEKWGVIVIVLIWKNLKSLACISSGAHELLDLAKTGLLSPGTSLRAVSGCLFAKNLFYSKPFFFCEDSFLRVGNFEVKYFLCFLNHFFQHLRLEGDMLLTKWGESGSVCTRSWGASYPNQNSLMPWSALRSWKRNWSGKMRMNMMITCTIQLLLPFWSMLLFTWSPYAAYVVLLTFEGVPGEWRGRSSCPLGHAG